MNWHELQYTIFIVLAPPVALIALATLVYAWVNRDPASKNVNSLSWLIVPLTGWIVFNTLELVAPTPQLTLFLATATYPFILTVPVAWFAFALRYAGFYRWFSPRRFAWIMLIPILNLIAVITNAQHGLFWARYQFVPVGNLLAMRVVSYGPFFWLMAGYGYVLVMTGAVLIARCAYKAAAIYRSQSLWMLFAALLPVLTNLIYIFRVFPDLTKDYTAISFAAASIAFAVGISRHDLFRLPPVARGFVVDNMPDSVFVVSANLRIVDLNPAAMALLASAHTPQADMVGKRLDHLPDPWRIFADWVLERDPAGDPPHDPNIVQNMAIQDFEIDLAGIIRSYDVRITPVKDPSTAVIGHLIAMREITDRKQAEIMLRKYALELEARNRELDAFARTVAHDLKTPLVGLVGFSQAIVDMGEDLSRQHVDDLLNEIVQSGMRMSNIVNSLLLLSSLRQEDTVGLEVLDMQAIVAEVVQRMGHAIRQHSAKVEVVVGHAVGGEGQWPKVVGYAPWVEEIWANYLDNALKYGLLPEADQPARILLGFDLPVASGYVRFWVRDWGRGVPEVEQARLFTEFTRLTQTGTKGHGLGLSIVRRIADRLGGAVGVDSTVGAGSTFWFTLPQAGTLTDAAPSPESLDPSFPDIG